MKNLVLLVLIVCCIACANNSGNTTVKVSEDETIFNMMVDNLKEYGGVSNVFCHFYYDVELPVLKKAFEAVDSTLTIEEIDSLCAVYDYKCSTSIHDLLHEKYEYLVVYIYPKENVSVLGYPIIVSDTKAVTINLHLKYITSKNVYSENAVAIVFEKKDGTWEVSNNIAIPLDDL